jgi:hypothetical protein
VCVCECVCVSVREREREKRLHMACYTDARTRAHAPTFAVSPSRTASVYSRWHAAFAAQPERVVPSPTSFGAQLDAVHDPTLLDDNGNNDHDNHADNNNSSSTSAPARSADAVARDGMAEVLLEAVGAAANAAAVVLASEHGVPRSPTRDDVLPLRRCVTLCAILVRPLVAGRAQQWPRWLTRWEAHRPRSCGDCTLTHLGWKTTSCGAHRPCPCIALRDHAQRPSSPACVLWQRRQLAVTWSWTRMRLSPATTPLSFQPRPSSC